MNRSLSRTLTLTAALLAGVPLGTRAQAPPAPAAPPALPPPPPPPPSPGPNPNAGLPPVGNKVQVNPNFGGGQPALPNLPDAPNTPAPPPPDAPAPTGVTLRYKFAPNQVQRYQMTMDLTGTVMAGPSGTGMPIKEHMVMMLHQTVQDVNKTDDSATLITQIDSLTMTMNGHDIPLPATAQQQIKQPITMVMTPTGKVLSVKMPANEATMPTGMGFNPTDLQNMNALKDGPANVGDSWRSSFTPASGAVEAHTLYTLSSLSADNSLATIAQKIWIQIKPPKTATAASTGPHINGLITGTGTEKFDVAAGAVSSQTSDLQMNLTAIPPTTARPGTPAAIKMTFHITTDMERVTGDATTAPNPAAPAPGGGDEPPTGQLQ